MGFSAALVAVSVVVVGSTSAPSLTWVGSVAGEQEWPRALPPDSIGPRSVINQTTPGAEDNLHGLEGGQAVLVNGTFHVFTAATFALPYAVSMRLEHWVSPDRIHWTRRPTLLTSTSAKRGKCSIDDPLAAVWEPIPRYDVDHERWIIFYTAYHCRGDSPIPGNSTWGYNGSIFLLGSEVHGYQGIDGPWADLGLVFHGKDQLTYLGTDSFHPYGPASDGRFYALVGLSTPRSDNYTKGIGSVGFATAPTMQGPWTWQSHNLPGEEKWWYVENPVVTVLPSGGWLAMMDSVRTKAPKGQSSEANSMVVMYSQDGLIWNTTLQSVQIPAGCRTPLGMVPLEARSPCIDRYALFYTHTFDHRPFSYCTDPQCGGDVGKSEGWEALFTGELDVRFGTGTKCMAAGHSSMTLVV